MHHQAHVCRLAQAKEREQGREDALHEMDKPLARYVDDADRDALLKAQDRIGDPMLEYLTKKKGSTSGTVKGKPVTVFTSCGTTVCGAYANNVVLCSGASQIQRSATSSKPLWNTSGISMGWP